jgi:hypothetical protein
MKPLQLRNFSHEESDYLRQVYREGNGASTTYLRAEILLYASMRWDVADIAPHVLATESDVASIIQRFNDTGVSSLYSS